VPREPDASEIEPPEIEPQNGARAWATVGDDAEEVDALPVLAPVPRVVRSYPASAALGRSRSVPVAIPAVQAAAVAAGGFVAGAAVVGLVHRRQRRTAAVSKGRRAGRAVSQPGRGGGAADRAVELLQIVGSRSLLVDVHLLGGRD
jgi:hypothetical protein